MFRTRLPPLIAMCASCGLVMMRSVLKRPCDFISSSVCETCFSNSATIESTDYTDFAERKRNTKPQNGAAGKRATWTGSPDCKRMGIRESLRESKRITKSNHSHEVHNGHDGNSIWLGGVVVVSV